MLKHVMTIYLLLFSWHAFGAQHWLDAEARSNIDVRLLYSIGLTESGSNSENGQYAPNPFAIGIGKDSRVGQEKHEGIYPKSKEEAIAILTDLLDKGYTNIGIGAMQVNLLYNGFRVDSPFALFDIDTNLRVATDILMECRKRKDVHSREDLVGCYATGEPGNEMGAAYNQKTIQNELNYALAFVNSIVREDPALTLLKTHIASIGATKSSSPRKIIISE